MNEEAMRKAFEAWAGENFMHVERHPSKPTYVHCTAVAECWAAWQAATRAAVPDGWRAVPVEPTVKMVDAGLSEWNTFGSSIDRAYDAMIAAAPEVQP